MASPLISSGEHTCEILGELGWDDESVNGLAEHGVVNAPGPGA